MINALDLNKIFMNSDIIREKGAFDEISTLSNPDCIFTLDNI